MGAGSGGRTKPYFRVSVDGIGAYTIEGIPSINPELTHHTMNGDYLNQILNIVYKIKGEK